MKDTGGIVAGLSKLYSSFGYRRFKMNKFEEYDLYVSNKNFLQSKNILTFTDTDGRLMALKPDVTLSIVKNCRDIPDEVEKLYYNENVYRPDKTTKTFREIKQTGLECIGDIDDHRLVEVLFLACESLELVSDENILDISDLDLLGYTIDNTAGAGVNRSALLRCVSQKNTHGISELCGSSSGKLIKLIALEGGDEIFPSLYALFDSDEWARRVKRFENIVKALSGCKVRVDFSVINDMNYYNGVVFNGFVYGISSAVLSGGRYDMLMKKMNKRSQAAGFAVYADLLERISVSSSSAEPDAVVTYDDNTDLCEFVDELKKQHQSGKNITVSKKRFEEGAKNG